MARSSPFCSCVSRAPTAVAEASVKSLKLLVMSGYANMGGETKAAFRAWNASWQFGVQVKTTLFLVRLVRGLATREKSFTNLL